MAFTKGLTRSVFAFCSKSVNGVVALRTEPGRVVPAAAKPLAPSATRRHAAAVAAAAPTAAAARGGRGKREEVRLGGLDLKVPRRAARLVVAREVARGARGARAARAAAEAGALGVADPAF